MKAFFCQNEIHKQRTTNNRQHTMSTKQKQTTSPRQKQTTSSRQQQTTSPRQQQTTSPRKQQTTKPGKEVNEFDTLTESEKKKAIAFSESLYKKMTEIGVENMKEYISTFTTDNKTEYYGYLNYLSFNDPMWKDYRLGFIDFDKFGQAGTPTGYKIEDHLDF